MFFCVFSCNFVAKKFDNTKFIGGSIMKRKICVMVLFLILLSYVIVNAVPFTTMGFMKVPDAYVLPKNIIKISTSAYIYNDQNDEYAKTLPDEMQFTPAFNLNFGVMDIAEIGFVYNLLPTIDDTVKWPNDKITKDIYYANIKLNFLKETGKYPSISIGVENLFADKNIDDIYKDRFDSNDDQTYNHDIDDYEANSFYLAISKSLLLRGIPFADYMEMYWTLGIGLNRFVGQSGVGKTMNGIFGSVESKLSKSISLVLEDDGYNVNFGIKYEIEKFSGMLGIYRINELHFNPHPRVAFGIQYNFDLLSNKKYSDRRPTFSQIDKEAPETTVIINRPLTEESGGIDTENPLEDNLIKIREKRYKAEAIIKEIEDTLK